MMTTTWRQIIRIDEDKCDGCGLCMPGCLEGALQIVAGKARLVRQSYCDGLGACLGRCPNGALTVETLETTAYDEAAVMAHLQETAPALLDEHLAHLREHAPDLLLPEYRPAALSGASTLPIAAATGRPAAQPAACPSVQIHFREPGPVAPAGPAPELASELRQWPVQLRLLPIRAPFFQDADLTLIADCVPFAHPDLHAHFIKGSAIAVGCPKLDDAEAYVEKVAQILQANAIRSLRVVYMEVPCCRGLVWIAEQALARSGRTLPFDTLMVPITLAPGPQ